MDDSYKELISCKYQVNLRYTESILKKKKIAYINKDDQPFKLYVKTEDYAKALSIVENLNLDESDVDDESDGYIEGYKEWSDKQFVSGYFTGGTIPRWMYSKKYATYFGPFFLLTGILFLIPYAMHLYNEFNINGGLTFLIMLIYPFCGMLMTIRAFKKKT